MNRMNTRAWRPHCWITESGIVLCQKHVKQVCTVAMNDAARETTAIIERMVLA